MCKTKFLIGFLLITVFNCAVFAQQKTKILDPQSKTMLLGRHRLSLQWISWDYFGTATVTQKNGILYLKGRQSSRDKKDFLTIDGIITSVGAKEFKFDGKIVMKISHINGGEPCPREGEMTFKITGKRKYWRLQEMNSPCDTTTDYVDIFFR